MGSRIQRPVAHADPRLGGTESWGPGFGRRWAAPARELGAATFGMYPIVAELAAWQEEPATRTHLLP